MAITLQPPLVRRNGHTLRVLLICRVSNPGPGRQDIRSLDDQQHLYDEWLPTAWDGPVDLNVIAGSGSGEALDRAEVAQAFDLVESGAIDLVFCEDLGRIMRRVAAFLFCEHYEDHGARLIALNDQVDTARDWRFAAIFGAFRHEMANDDASNRIRRTLRSRFTEGGVIQSLPPGYIKPRPHATDGECSKDPEAEPVYDEWFRRLESGESFAEIADWLDGIGFRVSAAGNASRWTGTAVGRITRNPILKGLRQRNRKMARRINRTGRRRSVAAPPEDLLERECPHLAFIDRQRYDRVLRLVNERNAHYSRRKVNGRDSRAGVPRKRTRWPGQHVHCGICGRLYVYGGHGRKEHLMCQGARDHVCWNGVTADGVLAAERISQAVITSIEAWPEYDAEILALLRRELDEHARERSRRLAEIVRERERVERASRHVLDAIRASGSTPLLAAELATIEQELSRLDDEQHELDAMAVPAVELPPLEQLKFDALAEFGGLAVRSHEFGQAMRRLVPTILVFPYQLLDGGRPVLRAAFDVDLSFLAIGAAANGAALTALRRRRVVDLFHPPQREAYRERIVQLRASMTERLIAADLDLTITATQHAMRLQRRMEAAGRTDAYLPLREPLDHGNKYRRHRHSRFDFSPLAGFELPAFPTD